MADITIPAAALEAGAKTLCSRAGYEWTVTPDVHNHWRAEACAAFLAMIEAWEGMSQLAENDSASIREMAALILPLPQENSDGK